MTLHQACVNLFPRRWKRERRVVPFYHRSYRGLVFVTKPSKKTEFIFSIYIHPFFPPCPGCVLWSMETWRANADHCVRVTTNLIPVHNLQRRAGPTFLRQTPTECMCNIYIFIFCRYDVIMVCFRIFASILFCQTAPRPSPKGHGHSILIFFYLGHDMTSTLPHYKSNLRLY